MRWLLLWLALAGPAFAIPDDREEEYSVEATITFPDETVPRTGRLVETQRKGSTRRRFLGFSRTLYFDDVAEDGAPRTRLVDRNAWERIRDLLAEYSRVRLVYQGQRVLAILQHVRFRMKRSDEVLCADHIDLEEPEGTFEILAPDYRHVLVTRELTDVAPAIPRRGCLAALLPWNWKF